jgi:hypothetical protein
MGINMYINHRQQQTVVKSVVIKFGEEHRVRIETGIQQIARRWRKSDGDFDAFRLFCENHFIVDSVELDDVFNRFQKNLESLYGNLHKIYRQFNWPLHVDTGELLKIDSLFANYDIFAHVTEDMFATKLAFVVLLNFPLESLESKTRDGMNWSRRKWAEIRLAEYFLDRIPGEVKQKYTAIYTSAEEYVYRYNIFVGNLRSVTGQQLFPNSLKLISHWGLRDEIKAQYANPDGYQHQKLLHKVMEAIINQTIPVQVINCPDYVWNPYENSLQDQQGQNVMPEPEPNKRYQILLDTFKAEQLIDPHTPDTPSLIDRQFRRNREILEEEVEAILIEVLSAPVLKSIAELISQRLSRDLEPFDIWYTGFKSGGQIREETLNKHIRQHFPNVKSFQQKMDTILQRLGFSEDRAKYLQNYIEVDPARGAGHALGAAMRWDKAHLRTRVPKGGMDYKGFNTAMHELGHTVEQVFTLNDIDYYTLRGVPNTAFTEAFAFVFQERDFKVLGVDLPETEINTTPLHDLWQTVEIAGVSLLDMRIWRWLYAHPNSDVEALKKAVIKLAKEIWNTYFSPIYGVKDSPILAIYSHILYCGMYIPDYAIGHIIANQINAFLEDKNLAVEMERMCRLGDLAPQIWMQQALGSPISPAPMIRRAEETIAKIKNTTT